MEVFDVARHTQPTARVCMACHLDRGFGCALGVGTAPGEVRL